jgi:polyisoprenoid-binding protein YceI
VKRRAITFASAAFFVTSLALASDTWIVDPRRSNARLFQCSRTNPERVNTGVARVTGKVKLDTNDLDASFFELSIYPADEDWGHTLSPEGALPVGYVPEAADQTLLTFKSTRILRTEDGKLEVVGDLTLSRVEHTVTATPTEACFGPVYRDPVIHSETHEIKFLFPGVSAEHLSGPLTPAMQHKNGVLEIVGSGDLPASAGEDYSGAQCNPATGNQITIVLDLKFLHVVQNRQ